MCVLLFFYVGVVVVDIGVAVVCVTVGCVCVVVVRIVVGCDVVFVISVGSVGYC